MKNLNKSNYYDSVREWYIAEFPEDDLGEFIRSELTFSYLFEALDAYLDVYLLLGVGDSIVRERVFSALAEIMGVEYGYIYDQWLLGQQMREV